MRYKPIDYFYIYQLRKTNNMYKITLLPEEDGEEINLESEIIFDNGVMIYLKDFGALNLSGKCFDIKEDLKGIEGITYWYSFN